MAKSSRASSKKVNHQKLKKNVFGPVETARTARLSAKLLEIASQPKASKPLVDAEMDVVNEDGQDVPAAKEETMEVDSVAKPPVKKTGRKGIVKHIAKRSPIVFAKFGEKKGPRNKKK
ncbi:hypothetical protein B0T17DRAFT_526768 [Bombardia bombarda]|uniref:DUF2423 domain-containing protein n=1 Tax=Bombardia bombarda TaxID=252184 RepID=A0AA40C8X2_9PEZI|nr:hypothetical protein B0T17DRAFT_526768 [Bombardia bombarda]